MRSSRAPALAVLAAVFALRAAPAGAVDLQLSVPEPLRVAWEEILSRHPLPAEARIVENRGRNGTPVAQDFLGRAALHARQVGRGAVAILRARGRAGRRFHRGSAGPAPGIDQPPPGGAASRRLVPGDAGYPLVQKIALVLAGADQVLDAWFDEVAASTARGPQDRVDWIGAVGDIMPGRGVDRLLARPGGMEEVLGDTLPVLQSSDLLLGNLEAAATRRGTPAVKSFTFRFDPATLARFAEAGFTWLSLTNNHSFDYGEAGFLDTLDALEKEGIGTSGAGRSEQEAQAALELAAGETTVRILSFGFYPVDRKGFDGGARPGRRAAEPGILWLEDSSIAAAARQFGPSSFDIAVVHGGEEWSRAPPARLRALCLRLLEAGADLVLGSHPHVLQPLEVVDGRLVAWSLGNFLFPGMEGTPGGEDSLILRIGIYRGAVRYVQIIPVRLKGTSVRLATPPRVSKTDDLGVTFTDKGDTR